MFDESEMQGFDKAAHLFYSYHFFPTDVTVKINYIYRSSMHVHKTNK